MEHQDVEVKEFMRHLGLAETSKKPTPMVRKAREDCFLPIGQPDLSKLNPHDLAILLKMGKKAERIASKELTAMDITSPLGKKRIGVHRDFIQISEILQRRLVREYDEFSPTSDMETQQDWDIESSEPIEHVISSNEFNAKEKCLRWNHTKAQRAKRFAFLDSLLDWENLDCNEYMADSIPEASNEASIEADNEAATEAATEATAEANTEADREFLAESHYCTKSIFQPLDRMDSQIIFIDLCEDVSSEDKENTLATINLVSYKDQMKSTLVM